MEFCNRRAPCGCHCTDPAAPAVRVESAPAPDRRTLRLHRLPDNTVKPLSLLRAMAYATLAAAASPFCAAQTQVRDWPAALPTGPFACTAAGYFTGDQRVSAYLISGSKVYLAFEPGSYHSISEVPVNNAVSLVPTRPAGTTTRERLVVTTTTGASLVTLNANATYTVTSTLSAAWAGARGLVQRRNPDGFGYVIAGISATGTSILTGYGVSGGDPLHLASIPIGAQLDAVALIDWDHDGLMEVAGIAAGWVLPFEIEGTPKPMRSFGGSNAVVSVLRGESIGERLAIVANIGSTPYVWTLDRTVTNPAVAIPTAGLNVTGTLQATGLADCDYDLDGDIDVLLSHSQSANVLLLTNNKATPTSPPFNSGSFLVITPNVPASTCNCAPVWTDMDHDDIPDLWQPRSSIDKLAFTPTAAPIMKAAESSWLADSEIDTPTIAAATKVRLHIPLDFLGDGIFDDYTVVVWHQGNPFTQPVPGLDVTSVHAASGNLDTLEKTSVSAVLEIPVNLTTYPVANHHHYYVELRRFSAASGEALPTLLAGFTLWPYEEASNSVANMAYLNSKSNSGEEKQVKEKSTRAEHIGGIITRIFPPPFGPNAPPQPGI